MRDVTALADRFLARVLIAGEDDCWLWLGPKDRDGYGTAAGSNTAPERTPHRLSYHLFVGPIDPGMTIDHVCFQRDCVNPRHLRQMTHQENARRQRPPTATQCSNGHPYSEGNVYVAPDGSRRGCRTCRLAATHRYRNRKRAVSSQ